MIGPKAPAYGLFWAASTFFGRIFQKFWNFQNFINGHNLAAWDNLYTYDLKTSGPPKKLITPLPQTKSKTS